MKTRRLLQMDNRWTLLYLIRHQAIIRLTTQTNTKPADYWKGNKQNIRELLTSRHQYTGVCIHLNVLTCCYNAGDCKDGERRGCCNLEWGMAPWLGGSYPHTLCSHIEGGSLWVWGRWRERAVRWGSHPRRIQRCVCRMWQQDLANHHCYAEVFVVWGY